MEAKMRFMVMGKATADSEAGVPPSAEAFEAMSRYNEELLKAGVLLAGDGLHPSSKGVRVRLEGDDRTVIDGPFAETKELIAGFLILEVASREEAVEWVKRGPNPAPGQIGEVEIRQIFEPEDFADVGTPEARAIEDGIGGMRREGG
jgi:hypothetical protein